MKVVELRREISALLQLPPPEHKANPETHLQQRLWQTFGKVTPAKIKQDEHLFLLAELSQINARHLKHSRHH